MHLLFDCTYTRLASGSVGITRTVRELAHQFLAMRGAGFDVSLVAWSPQGFRLLPDGALDERAAPAPDAPDAAIMRVLRLVGNPKLRAMVVTALPLQLQRSIWRLVSQHTYGNAAAAFPLVRPAPDQVFLSCDAAWSYDAPGALTQARAQGVRVVTGIMDLIPVNRPEFCLPLFTTVFGRWLNEVLASSDALVCISRATCDEVAEYCRQNRLRCPPMAPFRLGSSPLLDSTGGDASAPRRFIPPGTEHETFLVVGSVEPRKNHGYILDAFDAVWTTHPQARLIIVGRIADGTQATVNRMHSHPRLGNQLQFITDCNDAELDALYRTTRALIFASGAEGFGLPLVEARQRGCRVLASDIPALREIADAGVELFSLASSQALADIVVALLNTDDTEAPPPMPSFGWHDSAMELLDAVRRLLPTATAPD